MAVHERKASLTLGSNISTRGEFERVLNSLRLATFAILISVGLSVGLSIGFGVGNALWGLLAGTSATVLVGVLLKWRRGTIANLMARIIG